MIYTKKDIGIGQITKLNDLSIETRSRTLLVEHVIHRSTEISAPRAWRIDPEERLEKLGMENFPSSRSLRKRNKPVGQRATDKENSISSPPSLETLYFFQLANEICTPDKIFSARIQL